MERVFTWRTGAAGILQTPTVWELFPTASSEEGNSAASRATEWRPADGTLSAVESSALKVQSTFNSQSLSTLFKL